MSLDDDTLENWADRGQMALPRFPDRIVHESHRLDEGGMSLAMPRERTAQRLRKMEPGTRISMVSVDLKAKNAYQWAD